MNKETIRMQMLAGIITEGQYKEKLNEAQNPDNVVSAKARKAFYDAVKMIMSDLYDNKIMDDDIIDEYLGIEGGLLGDAIEAFLHDGNEEDEDFDDE
jgi:hypothetical protein